MTRHRRTETWKVQQTTPLTEARTLLGLWLDVQRRAIRAHLESKVDPRYTEDSDFINVILDDVGEFTITIGDYRTLLEEALPEDAA